MGKKWKIQRLVLLCVFCTLWKERNQRSFESKEIIDHVLKFTFICNLLWWIWMIIDGVSMTMLNLIDWLGSWRSFCFYCPFFFVLLLSFLCLQSMCFDVLLLNVVNTFVLFFCHFFSHESLVFIKDFMVVCRIELLAITSLVW